MSEKVDFNTSNTTTTTTTTSTLEEINERNRLREEAIAAHFNTKFTKSLSSQFKAIAFQQLTLLRRTRLTFCCQIIFPIIIVLLIGIFHGIAKTAERNYSSNSNMMNKADFSTTPSSIALKGLLRFDSDPSPSPSPLFNVKYDEDDDDDKGLYWLPEATEASICDSYDYNTFSEYYFTPRVRKWCSNSWDTDYQGHYRHYITTDGELSEESDLQAGYIDKTGAGEGFLASLEQFPYEVNYNDQSATFITPIYERVDNRQAAFDEDVSRREEFARLSQNCTAWYYDPEPGCLAWFLSIFEIPQGLITWNKLESESKTFSYEIAAGYYPTSLGYTPNYWWVPSNGWDPMDCSMYGIYFWDEDIKWRGVSDWYMDDFWCYQLLAQGMAHNALLSSIPGATNKTIEQTLASMPYDFTDYAFSYVDLSFDIASIIVFPILFSFMFPIVMYEIIYTRESGAFQMMRMMGLTKRSYWLSLTAFNYCLYLTSCTFFIVLAKIYNMHFFSPGYSPIALYFSVILFGFPLITSAYFLSNFFVSTRKALIFGYLVINIVLNSVCATLNFTLYNPYAVSNWKWRLIPHFNLSRLLYLYGSYNKYVDRVPVGTSAALLPPDWNNCILWLIIDAILYTGLAIYLTEVWTHGKGVPKSPFYPFYYLMSLARGSINDNRTMSADDAAYVLLEDSAKAEAEGEGGFKKDADVLAEETLVESGSFDQIPALLVKALSVVYPKTSRSAPKVALKEFSLQIPQKQCFCLLGPNGAGKSTLINSLVGVTKTSTGTAEIGGLDILTQMDQVRDNIAIVQQFDVLFDLLTCYEHVLFYSRLKGVPPTWENTHCMEALKLVGLDDAHWTLAKNLSGGMKRRLSIAITLVGSPTIIFMDEPTTGLDPASRRDLWDIINIVKKTRTIILTTHMMDEAETLSERVGIMAKGRLVALGSPTYLKSKFASGYSLSISHEPGRFTDVDSFIKSIAPSATLVTQFLNIVNYTLDAPLDLASVFSTLDNDSSKHGVKEFGISQSDLESVFLNVISDEDIDGN